MAAAALSACGGGGSGSEGSPPGSGLNSQEVQSAKASKSPGLLASGAGTVNMAGDGDQHVRAVGALADGGHTVAWLTEATPGGAASMSLQRFDAAGAKLGAQVDIALDVDPTSVALAVHGDGGVAAAYRATRSPSPAEPWIVSSGIYVRRFDAGGAPLGGETEVVSVVQNQAGARTLYYVADPAIVSWQDGSFVIGWASIREDYTGRVPEFQTQRYDGQGQPVGARLSVGSGDANTSFKLTAVPAGGYLVSTFRRVAGELHARFSQVDLGHTIALPYTADGLPAHSILLPLARGGYVLLSAQDGAASSQLFDGNGNVAGAARALASLPTFAGALADGGFAAFWASAGTEQVVAQRFDGTGAAVGELLHIDTDGAVPQAAGTRDGGLALAWSAAGPGGDLDVMTQRFLLPAPSR
ncbi:MAG: hypothetical protein H0X13_11345 [Ramlibacter sp.]|nr:hypothetical protein [Ramlibacter sp.]